jgi:hypothetical protein
MKQTEGRLAVEETAGALFLFSFNEKIIERVMT